MENRQALPPEGFAAGALLLLGALLRPWNADIPLNDDWSYILPAARLAADGVLKLTGDSPSTHVLHVLVGGAWLKALGGGIGSLKILMLLWHAAGSCLLARLLREEGVSGAAGRLALAAYIFNPLVLNLSLTFMTDIPYLTLTIASLYAYLKAARGEGSRWLLAGSCAAAAAYLVKQLGLFLPLAATLALRNELRRSPGKAVRIWAPVAAVFAAHQYWYHAIHGTVWRASVDSVYLRAFGVLLDPAKLLLDVPRHAAGAAFHLALFLFPFAAGFAAKDRFAAVRSRAGRLCVLFILAGAGLAVSRGAFPYLENSFYANGVGVPTASDTPFKPAGPFQWLGFWELLTAACLAAGAYLLTLDPFKKDGPARDPARSLLFWTAAFQFFVPFLTTKYLDRYTLYALPAILAIAARAARRLPFSPRPAWAVLWLGASLFTAAAADYAAWNKAKWSLAERAHAAGIAREKIEAGFDWDLYWNFEKEMEKRLKAKNFSEVSEWEWRRERRPEVFLSFASPEDIPGRSLYLEERYETPLSPGGGRLFLYRSE